MGISMGFLLRLHQVCPVNVKISGFVELDEAIILTYFDIGKYVGIYDCQMPTFRIFLHVKSHR